MAHLPRPLQIAIVALLVGAVAFAAFGMHRSSPSEPSSAATSSSAPATSSSSAGSQGSTPGLAAEEAKKAAAPSPIYHGSAPGVEGLTRAINKAHGAVASSQAEAKHLEEKSAQTSGEAGAAASSGAATAAPSAAAAAPSAAASSGSRSSATPQASPSKTAAPKRSAAEEALVPGGQRAVEAALAAGKVPVVLFWNPNGADDVVVHGQLQKLGHGRLPLAIYEGSAAAVAFYGSLTREVPVYGTPTILIVAKNGQTTVLTGLQEHFSIEQAIEEARHA
jgi:hypothetical protein